MTDSSSETPAINQIPVSPRPTLIGSLALSVVRLVKDFSGASIVLIFFLYALGYIILTTHLGRFGAHVGVLLSFDCVASALCYIGFVCAVGLPAWIICHRFFVAPWAIFGKQANIKERELVGLLILGWNLLLSWGAGAFLGAQSEVQDANVRMPIWYWYIIGAHLSLYLLLKFTKKLPRVLAFLTNWPWVALYITAPALTAFMRRPEIDGGFVISTIMLYTVLMNIETFVFGQQKEELKSRGEIQVLIALVWLFVIVSNAIAFGKNQFARLPATLGGGSPIEVSLRASSSNIQELQKVGLPLIGDSIGPVLMLFSSDKDVFVISTENFKNARGGAVEIRREFLNAIYTVPKPETYTRSKGATPSPSPSASISAGQPSK